MTGLVIEPDYQVMPALSDEDFAALKADIEARGVLVPVEYDEDGNILDGHHRVKACEELGIADWPRFVRKGLSEPEKRQHARQLNLARRHLTKEQKVPLWADMRGGGMSYRQIAEADGTVTKDTVQRALVSNETPEPERIEGRDGKSYSPRKPMRTTYVNPQNAQRAAKNSDLQSQPVPAVEGHYSTIVIDPPWPMQKIERDVRPNQVTFDYPTMEEDELSALDIPAAADCHMWLWTTHKFMPMAFRLLDTWGFRYVCTFTWHKPGGFQPIGLPQYNSEFALYARHGSPKFTTTKAFSTCFTAPRGAHSEKPSEFYEMVARVTDGQRLDMFNRRSIPGFKGWGNEAVE